MTVALCSNSGLADEVIYDDALTGGWLNYSWNSRVNFENSNPVFEGTKSISVKATAAYGSLYLFSETGVDVAANDEIKIQIRGSEAGQRVSIFASEITLDASQWREVAIQVEDLGGLSTLAGLAIQDASGNESGGPVFFIDQIEVGDFTTEQPQDALPGPAIIIDPSDQRGPISDGIYGLNFADQAFATEIGLSVNRRGGNSTTRYNYLIDTTNLASDFYYENMPQAIGQTSDEFVSKNLVTGTDSMITIGMLGYVAKSSEIIGSYSVAKYGDQTDVNMYRPDHGNGILLDGTRIENDPLDTGQPVDETFARDWVQDMVSTFGMADNGGVRYHMLDNEPMLWNSTHVDAHPQPASYDAVIEDGIRYAEAIKSADATAEIMGPAVFGWTAYFYSALDAAPGGEWYFNPQDQNAHGGVPFLIWYLDQMANYESENGTRLLDYLDIHYYPQHENVALEPAGDAQRQARRLESTRSLWDPDYIDDSWISDTVRLIPRMKEWIADHYPGTKLAINEYNFGAIEHINGAVTQADVLGIFGREGVDIACMWGPPASDQPAAYAFRMYRNYDGSVSEGGRFGETVVTTNSADSNKVSVFAADRAVDGALTIVLVNKTNNPLITPIVIANAIDVTAAVYNYSERRLDRIIRMGDIPFYDGEASITLEPNSITTLEVSEGAPPGEQPTIDTVVLNDGSNQRSRVQTMDLRFDSLVSFADNDPTLAISFSHTEQGLVNVVVDDVIEEGGATILKLSFTGQVTREDNALVDGNYHLAVDGNAYFDQTSRLAGTSFSIGADPTDLLYSLFGDSNGDRTVNILDLFRFRGTYRKPESDQGFAVEFDFNDDGVVNILDLIKFRENYRTFI